MDCKFVPVNSDHMVIRKRGKDCKFLPVNSDHLVIKRVNGF
jgi:hypothetical protein